MSESKETPEEFLAERLQNGGVIHRRGCAFWKKIPFWGSFWGSIARIPPDAEEACDCGLRRAALALASASPAERAPADTRSELEAQYERQGQMPAVAAGRIPR